MLPSDPGAGHIPTRQREDWYSGDEHLRWLLRDSLGEAVWPVADAALAELGALVPQRVEPLAVSADRNPPALRQYDATGARVDVIEFHPAYDELINTVLGFGTVRSAHLAGWRGLSGVAPRALTSAVSYMFLQADQAITGCPVGMMDAMARCLARNDPALAERFVPRIADDSGGHLTSAMFLTEKAGGSDVGANETVAVRDDDGGWRLHGEKWFASCPQSDLVLVMARPEGAPPGPAGLGLFLMPHVLDDGTRNAILIHRLKNKFGTRAMASGEVGLRGAFAWQVGQLDRGMRQMMDMVSLTRVGIVAATAGAMRRNTVEALAHTAQRSTFGGILQTHPLMRDSLAELVVDSTAALTATVAVSELLDEADAGDAEAGAHCACSPRCSRAISPSARASAAATPWRSAAATASSRTGRTRGCSATCPCTPSGRGRATSSRSTCCARCIAAPARTSSATSSAAPRPRVSAAPRQRWPHPCSGRSARSRIPSISSPARTRSRSNCRSVAWRGAWPSWQWAHGSRNRQTASPLR